MGFRGLVYRLYARRLESSLSPEVIPRHVGVMCDGNRRWARSAGLLDVASGHQKGADKIFELLEWCREAGVEVVTLWLLSTDNLTRPAAELEPLLRIIEDTVRGLVADRWHVNPMGALDLLPGGTARVLKDAAEATAGNPGLLVNVAIGYGGRREIADAVRSLLHEHATRGTSIEELAEILDVEHIAEHLYTAGAARPGPGHPHLGRTAHRRVPAVADHPFGVLLLRRLLAGFPQGRLPPRPALLRGEKSPLRRLTNPRGPVPARPHGAARPCGSVGANAAVTTTAMAPVRLLPPGGRPAAAAETAGLPGPYGWLD